MTDFLIYDLKVAVLIVVFYMFYRLLLSRETFHRVNRMVLLLTAVASFVLPLCVITMHKTVTVLAVPEVSIGDIQATVAEDSATPLWQIVLPVLYIIGMLAVLGHTLLSVWKVMRLIQQSEQHPEPDGTIVCVTGNADVAPFSWMHYIVMNRGDYEAHDSAILAHERGHILLRHSWDVLLVDFLTALQWFNPAMWMLRQDLRAIHEYEADGVVLSQGINARQYQYLLISKATSIGGYSVANGISHSTLKNRITMMLHKKSSRSHLLKLLALVPIIGTALALNARTVTDYVYDEPQKKIIKKGKKNAKINAGSLNEIVVVGYAELSTPDEQNTATATFTPDEQNVATGIFTPTDEDKVFDVVEQMPEYTGGVEALLKYLAENVRYPKEAEEKGLQGRVIATFVVEKDGSISRAEIVKSVDPLLDEEALRVINAMPNWVPGRQNGEAVAVKYAVPISFRLQGDVKDGNLLCIVDGEKVPAEKIKDVDPKTIDHMEVLKDKPAIEKYGNEAKNGVIIITTKKK